MGEKKTKKKKTKQIRLWQTISMALGEVRVKRVVKGKTPLGFKSKWHTGR